MVRAVGGGVGGPDAKEVGEISADLARALVLLTVPVAWWAGRVIWLASLSLGGLLGGA